MLDTNASFAWLRETLDSSEPIDNDALLDATRHVHAQNPRFHREVWTPYLTNFARRRRPPMLSLGSTQDMGRAHELMPMASFHLTLSGREVRRFTRLPQALCARVVSLSIDGTRTASRHTRALLASPNLRACTSLTLVGRELDARGADAFVTNDDARHLTRLTLTLLEGAHVETLRHYAPHERLHLRLSNAFDMTPDVAAALLGSELGASLHRFDVARTMRHDAFHTLTRTHALERLQILDMSAFTHDTRTITSLARARFAPSLQRVLFDMGRSNPANRPSGALWSAFFEHAHRWELSELHVPVFDRRLGWLESLSRWDPLARIARLFLHVSGVDARDIITHIQRIGTEPFEHLRVFDVDGTDVLTMFRPPSDQTSAGAHSTGPHSS